MTIKCALLEVGTIANGQGHPLSGGKVKYTHSHSEAASVLLTCHYRGAGASPAGTAAAGPMLEAKLMNLIKGQLQKF